MDIDHLTKGRALSYRQPYPAWIVMGMDVMAAGILVASFRDAWTVVKSLGQDSSGLANSLVAAAVVLAIDASILLLEQARSHVKLRGGNTRYSDLWVGALILISAMLNVRYLTAGGALLDKVIGAVLGVAIPSTIAVLGYLKGDMLAYNAQLRSRIAEDGEQRGGADPLESPDEPPMPLRRKRRENEAATAGDETVAPMFRLNR